MPPERTYKFKEVMSRLQDLETDSKCERGRVACILYDEYGVEVAHGVNGWNNKPCARPNAQGNCGCLHAELTTALGFFDRLPPTLPKFAVISRAPCEQCAKILVSMGIIEVYYVLDSWPMQGGIDVLNAACVKSIKIGTP